MKSMTCECGHAEQGATENLVLSRMESHIKNQHPERDSKKMLTHARKSVTEVVMA